jgi:hypothetical protein
MSGHDMKNMKLLSHDSLLGFGGIGEGMSLQIAKDGRRIMWLAHEGPPKNFTAVDVTDPRKPKVIVQTDLPHTNMRSNSLEICGDIMAVAYQTYGWNIESAGIELFDISKPEQPKSISFFDCRGPRSRGVHCVWYVDGEFIHCAGGAEDYMPRHPRDDQCYRIIDVRNPSKPAEAGRWWLPRQLPRPQFQRLSGAAGPRLYRLSRRRRDHPRHIGQVEAEAHLAMEPAPALPRFHPYGDAASGARPDDRRRRMHAG